MTIQVSEFYQRIPDGAIPEGVVSSLFVAFSDASILKPYYANQLTENLMTQLSLKESSNIRSDDQYLYFAFTVLVEILMKADATFAKSPANQIGIELFLSNPSFKDWFCSQSIIQDVRSKIYQFLAKLSGKKTSEHIQTHLINGLRESVVEPILYYLYEDKKRLLEEVARIVSSQVSSKGKTLYKVKDKIQELSEKISSRSTDEAIDTGIELAQSLVSGSKKVTPVRAGTVSVFFQLFTSPKPKELLNVLSIHGLVETSLVSFVYARPNVTDLTVRTIATVAGSYTGYTALCAIVAHSYLGKTRKDFIPSKTDQQLMKLFKTIQQKTRRGVEIAHSTLETGMNERKISPLTQKYVLSFPQFMTAFVVAELFYRNASPMKTAIYIPYILEHFGHLLSNHWGVCNQGTFEFNNKLSAVALQVAIGTISQVVFKDMKLQMIPAILTTPFMLEQMQESRLYRSFVKRIKSNSSSETRKVLKGLKRTWKTFSLTTDVVNGVFPSVTTWSKRALVTASVGITGKMVHKNRDHLQKMKNKIVSLVGKGADFYGVYYRVQLAATVVGKTAAPVIELIVDPSNLSKVAGVFAASLVQHISESPLAAVTTAQSVEMICQRFQVFQYRDLQSRTTAGWIKAQSYSLALAKQAEKMFRKAS